MSPRPRIAFLIRSLNYGGAEMQLTILANEFARAGYAVSLLVFYPNGPLVSRVSPKVTVRCLEKRGRWDVLGFLRSLFRALDEEQADVLYAFLQVANLLACLIKLHSPKLKVVWGVRASDMDLAHYDWLSRLTYRLERRFSHRPNLIIANSMAGRRYAVSRGFPDSDHFIVIPNGIDVQRFQPNADMRRTMRAEWGIEPDETLVGIVARLDPMKDYSNFLEAAARVAQHESRVRFVSVGAGPDAYATVLRQQSSRLGLENRMIWAGPRNDLPAVYNGLDLLVSSSAFGEGFSNVLGEAMSCGVPCVATDVGDAREILGDIGVIVPPSNPAALADGIVVMLQRLDSEGNGFGTRVRQRIAENFSVEMMVRRTEAALETMA